MGEWTFRTDDFGFGSEEAGDFEAEFSVLLEVECCWDRAFDCLGLRNWKKK